MIAEGFSGEQIEEVYDFLDKNFKKLLELEKESIKSYNVTREGNLVKIKANELIYIVPNYISLWYFTNKDIFDRKLKENADFLVILNNYPGYDIFIDFSDSFVIGGLLELNKYYKILKNYRGKIIPLGGKSKIEAIEWFKDVFKLDRSIVKSVIKDIYNKFLAKKFFEKVESKYNTPEILEFNMVINESETKKKLSEIILHYTSLPSALYIDFRNVKMLNIPGELPLLVFNRKIIREYLEQENLESLIDKIIKNFEPFSLDHIIKMKHGDFLDRKISYEDNISIENLYKLEIYSEELYKLPIKKKILLNLINEKSRFKKEIFKYLLFAPEILKKNKLDYVIAGNEFINTLISVNDPTDKIMLYNKSKIYLIEIDPDKLEKHEKIKIYDHSNNIREIDLNYKDKKILEKIDEIIKDYKETDFLLNLLFNDIFSKEKLRKSPHELLIFSLILDEAYNQIPFLKRKIKNKGN